MADIALVWTQTNRELKHKGVTCFIVERGTEGFEVGDEEHKMGIRGSNTVSYLQECRVPKTDILGPVGDGFKIAMMTLDGGRIGIAAQAVGIAQARWTRRCNTPSSARRSAGRSPISRRSSSRSPTWRWRCRPRGLLTYCAAWTKDQGGRYSQQAAHGQAPRQRDGHAVAHQAVQIHGGYGYLQDFPVERLYRDARITEIYEGTSEIQRLVIAGQVLKGGRA